LSVEFRIEGAEDFARKMRKLDEATREYVQEALVQTAQQVMFRARQLAPVRTGRLMQSIYAEVIYKWVVKVGCYVPYALFQEFGTRYISPRYFLTRALQESAPKLVSIVNLALQHAIAEAAAE